MRHPSLFVLAIAAFGLAACGGEPPVDNDGAETTDSAEPVVIEVIEDDGPAADSSAPGFDLATTNQIGTFEGEVAGLALWYNPGTVFRGRLYAANGEAGLYGIALDRSAVAAEEGVFDGPVAVGQTEGGAVLAAGQNGGLDIGFHAVTEEGLSLLTTLEGMEIGAREVCFANGQADAFQRPALVLREDGRAGVMRLTVDAQGAEAEDGGVARTPTITHCAVAGDELLVSIGKRIETAELTFKTENYPSSVALSDTGVTASATIADLAAVETDDGALPIALRRDGIIEISGKELDLTGLPSGKPVQIIAGSGNYGGINRGGMLVILTEGNEVVSVPWLIIAEQLDLPRQTLAPESLALPTGAENAPLPGPAMPDIEIRLPE